MTDFQRKRFTKDERDGYIRRGLVKLVAEATGFTIATVSRTLHGKFNRPNPKIVRALHLQIEKFKAEDAPMIQERERAIA